MAQFNLDDYVPSDSDDEAAAPARGPAFLARWCPAAQEHVLDRLADRPPLRHGRVAAGGAPTAPRLYLRPSGTRRDDARLG